jgi:hypothetical protein
MLWSVYYKSFNNKNYYETIVAKEETIMKEANKSIYKKDDRDKIISVNKIDE